MEEGLSVPPAKLDDSSSSQELSKFTLQGLGVQAGQGLKARGRERGGTALQDLEEAISR
jgi:hypothetical protein